MIAAENSLCGRSAVIMRFDVHVFRETLHPSMHPQGPVTRRRATQNEKTERLVDKRQGGPDDELPQSP